MFKKIALALAVTGVTMGANVAPAQAMSIPSTQDNGGFYSVYKGRTPITTSSQARAALYSVPIDITPYLGKYDRTGQFGTAWIDMNRNGCDTRNDILARDLRNTVGSSTDNCTVFSGKLYDPYNKGKVINFVRGNTTSSAVQIDHVIPLKYIITAGGDKMTDVQRKMIANDPENLLAVDGPTNVSKSDKGPSAWNVPNNPAYRCTYAIKWVNILKKYPQLQVKASDKLALTRQLAVCG